MELRWYQKQAVDQLRDAIMSSKSALFCLPTGGGKSAVAGEIARLASAKGKRTLFLAHRRELVRQLYGTLTEFCPSMSIGIEAAGFLSMPWADLQIASVASLVRRNINLRPDIIVVDECHHARARSWALILQRYPHAKRLGLSATPQRLDGRGLGEFFNSLVLGPSIADLVEQGYLASMRTLSLPSQFRRDAIRKDKHGEFHQSDIGEQVTDKVIADGVAAYMKYARGRRTLFFAVHRDHSRKVAADYGHKGSTLSILTVRIHPHDGTGWCNLGQRVVFLY